MVQMKAYLRKYRALTFEDLDLALYQAFAAVTLRTVVTGLLVPVIVDILWGCSKCET